MATEVYIRTYANLGGCGYRIDGTVNGGAILPNIDMRLEDPVTTMRGGPIEFAEVLRKSEHCQIRICCDCTTDQAIGALQGLLAGRKDGWVIPKVSITDKEMTILVQSADGDYLEFLLTLGAWRATFRLEVTHNGGLIRECYRIVMGTRFEVVEYVPVKMAWSECRLAPSEWQKLRPRRELEFCKCDCCLASSPCSSRYMAYVREYGPQMGVMELPST